jgi:thiol-disulfide isomerase/thioredoxin
MIEIIDVKKRKHINTLNAAAKQAHDHPETHGLLVKIYATWCGHCRNMTEDWNRLTHELKEEYKCKKPGCVLTIANIRAGDLGPNDSMIQNLKYIPKDIKSIPTIMYISKGVRGLEYTNDRVYSEMLKWIVAHPDFGLVRKDATPATETDKPSSILRSITKKARIKFKDFHRGTLKKFHKEMRRQHKKSVRSRMATPVAPGAMRGYVPAYLME